MDVKAWIVVVVMAAERTGQIWVCLESRVNRTGWWEREKEKRSEENDSYKIEIFVVCGITESLALNQCELCHPMGEVTIAQKCTILTDK